MKLVFYDGSLNLFFLKVDCIRAYLKKWCKPQEDIDIVKILNAGFGISEVLKQYEELNNRYKNLIAITNSPELLNCVEHKNDIYLMLLDDDPYGLTFKPIQECCDREIRDSLNIQKLYLSGVFGNVYIPERNKKHLFN